MYIYIYIYVLIFLLLPDSKSTGDVPAGPGARRHPEMLRLETSVTSLVVRKLFPPKRDSARSQRPLTNRPSSRDWPQAAEIRAAPM